MVFLFFMLNITVKRWELQFSHGRGNAEQFIAIIIILLSGTMPHGQSGSVMDLCFIYNTKYTSAVDMLNQAHIPMHAL